MNIMQQPYFLNNGGNRKAKDGIMLWYAGKNPYIRGIKGDVTIHSTYNGIAYTESYTSLINLVSVSIKADPNTEVYIEGKITEILLSSSETKVVCRNTALTSIDCSFNSWITELDLSKNTALTSIDCSSCNGLTELDLSKSTALTSIECSSCNGLTELDLSKNTALTSINCSRNSWITELDLSKNTALTSINCSYCNGLTELDLSKNTALTSIECSSCNGLTELDLSKNTALTRMECTYCGKLSKLDFSNNTLLDIIFCYNCFSLAELHLPDGEVLKNLQCSPDESLTTIYAIAKVSNVANQIANAIKKAGSTDGTLYINSSDTYASTVISAATAKGWTVKDLPAA